MIRGTLDGYVAIEGKLNTFRREQAGKLLDTDGYEVGIHNGMTLAEYAAMPPPRRLVPKSVIIARLQEAGKLAAASAAINVDLYVRERWYAPDRPAIYADDPEALALLTAIGADPKVILA